jgi:hypothetical protein
MAQHAEAVEARVSAKAPAQSVRVAVSDAITWEVEFLCAKQELALTISGDESVSGHPRNSGAIPRGPKITHRQEAFSGEKRNTPTCPLRTLAESDLSTD